MTTRRSFLGAVAGGAAAATAFRGLAHAAGGAKPPLGLQLWSLRRALAKDVPGTLEAGQGLGLRRGRDLRARSAPRSPPQLKAAGLKVRAMHIGYDRLPGDMAGVLRDADAVGRDDDRQPLPAARQAEAPGDAARRSCKAAADFAKWSKAVPGGGQALRLPHPRPGVRPGARGHALRRAGEGVGAGRRLRGRRLLGGLRGRRPGRAHEEVPGPRLVHAPQGHGEGHRARLGGGALARTSNVVLGTGQIDIKGIVAAGAEGRRRDPLSSRTRAPTPSGQIPKSVAYYKSL